MRFVFLLLLTFLCCAGLSAQNKYSADGITVDGADGIKLYNSSVSILNAKDSTLLAFTRSKEDGSFHLTDLFKGKFLLLVSYPYYADYVEHFSLDSLHQVYNPGSVNMQLKERLLKEVVVKGTAVAIRIKGDTTEFNARAYTVQPNAKVEDLLQQLPGIQIDKNGKITAQGQTVNKVLVDGEEFFGDDPTLVTKNIRADMVDKVQLYDKKSDQATFTGVDDGVKTKTINIKLKSDKKNGMFGRGEAGGGTAGFFQAQAAVNIFKAKQKFSAYGVAGNDGQVGLGWEDNQKYGAAMDMEFGDGGEMYISGGTDDLDQYDGRYSGQGIPSAHNAGLHYDSKWNSDKESINTNYKTGNIAVDGSSNLQVQNNLPGAVLNSLSGQESHKFMFRQKLDAVYKIKLDSLSDLKVSVDGTNRHSTTNEYYTSSEQRNDTLINMGNRRLTNTVDQDAFNLSAFYTKKFKKKGRTLSVTLADSYSKSDARGHLNSSIQFYDLQGNKDSLQLINQYKTNYLQSNRITTNIAWSEPLFKRISLILNYKLGLSSSLSDRQSFNESPSGAYNIRVDSLSSRYNLTQTNNEAGARFNYTKGKTIINFGTGINNVRLYQVDEFTHSIYNRRFTNWSPQVSYRYRFSPQSSLRLSYGGQTTQPTLDELQPLRVNTDPLNIILGNPDLKPSLTNTFNFNYYSYSVITSQSFSLYGNYAITSDPIVSDVSVNPVSGKSISRYSNLPGKNTNSYYMGGDFSRKLPFWDLNLGAGMNANGNTFYNLVNGVINLTKNYVYNPTLNIYSYKEKKYDYRFSGGPTFTIGQSSLQPLVNNNNTGFKADATVNIYLPGKFLIGTNSNYEYDGKSESFNKAFSKLIINAHLGKKFLKTDNLYLEVSVNDLLNQNTGFERTATANTITQNSYTSIKRYFMLKLSYDFTKMGVSAAK